MLSTETQPANAKRMIEMRPPNGPNGNSNAYQKSALSPSRMELQDMPSMRARATASTRPEFQTTDDDEHDPVTITASIPSASIGAAQEPDATHCRQISMGKCVFQDRQDAKYPCQASEYYHKGKDGLWQVLTLNLQL